MRQAQQDVTDKQYLARLAEDPANRRARRIDSFAPDYRERVRDLTCCGKPFEDLADTFPALLFAIATGYGDAGRREAAVAGIAAGAPLRQVADALGLPWWLRRLPAQAFTAPLLAVPADPEFTGRIAAFIPSQPGATPAWLGSVLHAYRACHTEYALWLARHYRSVGPQTREDCLGYLAAWAWHAHQPRTPGAGLIRRPWAPGLSLRRATDETTAWRRRIALALCLGPGVDDTWLADGRAGGYEFVALRTVADFIAESEVMDNCLDQYASRLEGSVVRVFSVRKDGRSVADVEISCHEQEVGMPAISQLRAARNRRAPAEVWQAAYAWLGGQPLKPLSASLLLSETADRRRTQRQFWRPYLAFLPGDLAKRFEALVLGRDAASKRSLPRRRRENPTRSNRHHHDRRTAQAIRI